MTERHSFDRIGLARPCGITWWDDNGRYLGGEMCASYLNQDAAHPEHARLAWKHYDWDAHAAEEDRKAARPAPPLALGELPRPLGGPRETSAPGELDAAGSGSTEEVSGPPSGPCAILPPAGPASQAPLTAPAVPCSYRHDA